MLMYLGHTYDHFTVEQIRARPEVLGFLVQRGYLRRVKKDIRWAYDNGAFSDFIHSRPFNEEEFLKDIERIERDSMKPRWVVLPDIVQGGLSSLDHSLMWLEKLPVGIPYMLAVQDGMEPVDVEPHLPYFTGVFVGGSTEFKATLPDWVKLAHRYHKTCHLGRSSSRNRVMWAKLCGTDSCDSSTFQFQRDRLEDFLRFVDAGYVTRQMWFDFFNVQTEGWT